MARRKAPDTPKPYDDPNGLNAGQDIRVLSGPHKESVGMITRTTRDHVTANLAGEGEVNLSKAQIVLASQRTGFGDILRSALDKPTE